MDSLETVKEEHNTSQQVCPKCHGKKIVYGENMIQILNLCARCGGYGELDWIDYATGNTTTREINMELGLLLTVRNAEMLAHKIKELFRLTGTMVRVNVSIIDQKLNHPGPVAKETDVIMTEEIVEELISI